MSPRTEAVVSATLPIVPILLPLGIHFILVSFVLLFTWLPATYYFSHLILFLVGLWACHDKDSLISAITVVAVVLFTMLLDIIQLSINFPVSQASYGPGASEYNTTWQFSAGMSIINLLFKPVTVLLTSIAVYVRAGGALPGKLGGSSDRDSYNRIHESSDGQQS